MILSMVPSVWAADEMQQNDTDDTAAQETKTPAESKMNGDCGATDADHVKWALTKNTDGTTYTLTISGDGDMADFTQPTKPGAEGAHIAPWYAALADSADSESNTVPITEVVVRDGVTGLGNWAFAYTQVTEATFTESVKNYGIQLYSHCSELTTVDWTNFAPKKVMLSKDDTTPYEGAAIPGNLFDSDGKLHICIVDGNTYTNTLVVPAGVAAVGTSGFYGTSFQTVDFKNGLPGVKQVGFYSFADMQSLKALTIPGYMQFVLGGTDKTLSNAFSEVFNATCMVIEEGIKVIPASMARQWTSMETLQLPSTITKIENRAFDNAKCLHSVDMSKITGSLTVDAAFNTWGEGDPVNCVFYVNSSEIQAILSEDNWGTRYHNKIFAITNGGIFQDDTKFEAGKLATPVKDGYVFAGWYEKEDCSGTTVDTPTAGKTYYAKWNTAVLSGDCGAVGNEKNVHWALTKNTDGTTYTLAISGNGAMADYSCNITRDDAAQPWRESQTGVAPSAISKVVVGNGVTNIGKFACNGLNYVKEYKIAATVQTISSWGIDTQSVETFTLNENKNFIVDEDGVLMNAAGDTMIAYPGGKAAVDVYKVPASVEKIDSGAFVGCDAKEIIVPNTVKSFPAWSLSASTTEKVVFDAGVESIGNGTFAGADKLSAIEFGETAKTTLKELGEASLSSLPALTSIELPASLVTIGNQVFGNTPLTEITIPDNVTSIGNQAFKIIDGSEPQLRKVTFGKTMPKLGNQIFLDQKNLAAIDMTRCTNVETVGSAQNFDGRSVYQTVPTLYVASENAMTSYKTVNGIRLIYAVANGGTFPADTKFEAGKLATPVKDGCRFDGWYKDSGFTGNAVTVAEAGQTYYAKWEVKAEKTAPAAPELNDRTYTSITLKTIEGAQYRCNGGAWQTSPEFTGLTAGTAYTFEAYYPETNDCKASPVSEKAEFSTLYRSSGGSSSSGSSYAVSAPSAKNGDVTVSPKNASKGDRVTITVTPDKGYELDKLTVKDASGNKLKLTDKGDGKYTFTMPGSKVTVSAEFVEEQAASIFADVPADAYYAKAVEWAVKKGITNGKANGLFGSNDPCTRGQIVTFLWRAAGSPAPKGTAKVPGDVLPGSYCYDAVAWALENGITNGLADGTFGVNNTCTRGQSVTFLYRAMGIAPTTVNGFTDVAADSFCAEAVAWAVENGVTNGTSATAFSPSNGCTRAQIVTFLFRAYNK